MRLMRRKIIPLNPPLIKGIIPLNPPLVKEDLRGIIKRGRGDYGITLMELIVVITVIGILIVAFGLTFQGWLARYKVESEMKDMYADLMNAKARAMNRNRVHFVDFTATQYTISEDIDPWPNGDGFLTSNDSNRPAGYTDQIPFLQKDLEQNYPITWSDPADTQISFNSTGLSSEDKTICSSTNNEADYNCIVISATRINIGQLITRIPDGGACDANNCTER
jgi:Tfp pilus assembly protein FimT